jgi:thiamine kinase-like enzyme
LSRSPLDPGHLDRVPFLAGRDRAGWRIEPIGSVTNQTWHVTAGADSYVVRVAGPTTSYLDREIETHNASIAAGLGLTPAILFLDDTLLVARYVAGARPLTAADLGDPDRLLQVAALLSRLQHSVHPFRGERHPFGEIDRYLGRHPHVRATALRQAARPVEGALARSLRPLVPAHVDAGSANFLLAGDGRLWLVDWEFSSMADPAWDPATVLMQRATDDDAAARQFVAAVLGDAGEATLARVGLFETALCLVAGSWCAMEAAARGNAAVMQMAERYLDRGEALLADARMPRWLRAV